MTKAILKLEGMERLQGEAEVGGDYVRLLVDTPKAADDFDMPARGEIEINGRTSKIALENATPATNGDKGVVLTLRLFTPLG